MKFYILSVLSCYSWQYSCTDLQTLLMQSLQHSLPVTNDENTVPTYQIIGLGFYTTPGGVTTTSGFYVDEVSVSSEKRNFAWENVRHFLCCYYDWIVKFFHMHSWRVQPMLL